MKKLIIILSLLISFQVLAQDVQEPSWRSKGREMVTRMLGEKWGERLFGPPPAPPVPVVSLPVIPKLTNKATEVQNKQQKPITEFERLPKARQRQFDYAFIQELFRATRKADAKEEDLANWLNVLEQGGAREGVYQALVLDEVYANLESLEEKPSSKLLDFSLKFSESYLGQTFKRESLEGLNLFSLKRILTEKSLDLMEFFEVTNLDDLYRWYAVLSSDLAKNPNASVLKSELRRNADPEVHYQWAKAMPIQHIKSEFIIKLHTIMNTLQMI